MELDSLMSMFQRCFGYVSDDSFTTMIKDQHQPIVTLDTFRMGSCVGHVFELITD